LNISQNISGQYAIEFNNCTIKIDKAKFENKVMESTEHFVNIKPQNVIAIEEPINFEKIILSQKENIKKINELHYHKYTSIAIGSFTIALIIIGLIVLVYICKSQKKLSIKIKRKDSIASIIARNRASKVKEINTIT